MMAAVIVGAVILLAIPPAAANKGGPDSYGYIWVDSRAPSPTVSYSWIDILSRGTRLTLSDDGCTFEVSMGFQFRFYGTITDYVFICSNGFVTFDVPDSFTADPPIPSTNAPNNRVVGLGMDLNPAASGSGGIYYYSEPTATPRRFVVTWNGVYKFATTRPETFQIVLEQNETTKDGRVLFQYRTLNDVSSPMPLVGIENKTGTSGLAYPGPLENTLAVAFYPPSDAGLPPDQLRVAATPLAPDFVQQGASNVLMARLDLTTPTNSIDVSAVRVVLSGLRAGPEDVTRARLWLDNGNAIFDPPGDVSIVHSAFSGTPPSARLEPASPLHVTTAGAVRLFVTYDVATAAGIGDWIGLRLPDTSHVSVAFPDLVGTTGFPVETYAANVRTRIDASQDTMTLSQVDSLLPAEVRQWETDVPALSLRFSADKNFVELAGLRVALGGTADASDVWAVKAIWDRDGDGAFTPITDEVLAIGAPSGSPPATSLGFSLIVNAGAPERVLLLLDVAPGALPGHVLNVTVGLADVQLGGGSDAVSPTNFPAVTGDRTVVPGARPALRLPWFGAIPTPDGIWVEGEYLLGPDNTASLARPAGNRVAGYVTAENSGTSLYVAVDAPPDVALDAGDGLAIAFDTDRDGFPTPDADDVFLVNATGAGHYRFSLVAGTWTLVADCTSSTTPACASGVGVTAFDRSPHRFYELAIPLATLGIAAGDTVHFAVAGPPYGGLSDAGGRSTWPLLFGTAMPPLGYFGALVLAPGTTPNQPPSLDWTGGPGYESDGIDPDEGNGSSVFRYQVLYVDSDNDPPSVGEPRLYVLESGAEIPFSPFPMTSVTPKGGNFRVGVVHFHDLTLPCGGNYSYHMGARDARGLTANDTPVQSGPLVACPNQPPTLAGDRVDPSAGTVGLTVFTYRVEYSDAENETPIASPELFIEQGGTPVASPPLGLSGWVGEVGSYVDGAVYTGTHVFSQDGLNFTYRFRASDGTSIVDTSAVLGPYVLPPAPDVLGVSGADLADYVVDEGALDVPFLGLVLSPSAEINVTGLKVDVIGTISDEYVLAVYLYRDMDNNRVLTGPDVHLGTEQPLGGTMEFTFPLQIASLTFVFLVVDLRTPGVADATVGLEVRDPSYVRVGAGDTVASFPPYRSTQAYVNVPPSAADPTVDGHGVGSAGILHVLSDKPTLAWRFSDENAADVDQIAYNVSVSEGAAPPWYRNETGALATVDYEGATLVDGRTYLLTISLSDGRLWSMPASVFFRMNTRPAVPTHLAPPDLATNVNPDAALLWYPVTDGDAGDTITYTSWVSENPGFVPATSNSTVAPGVTLALAPGTTYYWKVGASDGFESSGNSSAWRFTTSAGGPGPVRGAIHGRVLNGTIPLPYALVDLRVDGTTVDSQLAATDGTFRFQDLELRAYVVRFSAFGFQTATRAATLTTTEPVVSLDVILIPYSPPDGGGDGENPPTGVPPLPLGVLVVLLAIALALCLSSLALSMRRRREPEGVPAETSESTEPDRTPAVNPDDPDPDEGRTAGDD